MDEQLLTLNESAELLKVHPETLRRWDRDGTLPAVKVNDRGDRRYRKSDLLEFIGSEPGLIKYGDAIIHNDHSIIWHSEGFVSMPGSFGVIAKLIVSHDNEHTGFAFATSGMQLFASPDKEVVLDELAVKQVKRFIDNQLLSDEDVYTFEYHNRDFREVQNPEWWQGRYSKTIVSGLRIEAGPTHSTTVENKAWRVILNFKSKNGNYWVNNTFGVENSFHEYFVWVDSKELARRGLPNTAKGAEIIAMEYGIKRFNETKDDDGNRDISRINENNAACFNGQCFKDRLLPEEEKLV